jgi:hypothetical protein
MRTSVLVVSHNQGARTCDSRTLSCHISDTFEVPYHMYYNCARYKNM